jgi:hypothetical protein
VYGPNISTQHACSVTGMAASINSQSIDVGLLGFLFEKEISYPLIPSYLIIQFKKTI